MTPRIKLNPTYTPGIPETLTGTLESPKPNPRGLCAKLAHFWVKVQKTKPNRFLKSLGSQICGLESQTQGFGPKCKIDLI
jgi:hypothetical protein